MILPILHRCGSWFLVMVGSLLLIMCAPTAIKIFISIFGRQLIARTVGLLRSASRERSSTANKAGSGETQISWRD